MKTPPRHRNRRSLSFLLAAAATFPIGHSLSAANVTWNNTATGFNVPGNWSTNTIPGTADQAVFAATEAFQPTLTVSDTIQGVQFSTTTSSGYDISSANGSTLTLTSSSGTPANGALNGVNTSGTNTIDVGVILGGTATAQNIVQAAGGTLVLNGIISATSAANQVGLGGGGAIQFNGANTFGGGIRLNSAATVIGLGNASALGTGTIVALAGMFDNISSGDLTLANALTLTSATYLGSARNLTISGATALASATSGVVVTANTLTLSSAVSGTGFGIAKTGVGALVLSNNNTFTGAITATNGTVTLGGSNQTSGVTVNGVSLNLGAANALGANVLTVNSSTASTVDNTSGAALTLPNAVALNTTLNYGTSTGTSANNLIFTGAVSINNSRLIVLNGAGALTFSGGLINTTVNGYGVIVNNGTGTTAATALNLGGFTLATSSAASVSSFLGGSASQSGTGNVNVTGAIVDGGSFANGLSVKTTGIATLTGTNTYGGPTVLGAAGTLLINGANNGAGAVSANFTGAQIGGSGSVAGMLTIGSISTLTPGSTNVSGNIGTFGARGGLALNGTYLIDLGASAASTDLTAVTGALTLTSTTSILTVRSLAAGATIGNVYEILTASGGVIASTFKGFADGSTYTDAAGDAFTVHYNDLTNSTVLGDVSLTLTGIAAVPEPSTWTAGLGMLGLLGWRCRRSAKRAAKLVG